LKSRERRKGERESSGSGGKAKGRRKNEKGKKNSAVEGRVESPISTAKRLIARGLSKAAATRPNFESSLNGQKIDLGAGTFLSPNLAGKSHFLSKDFVVRNKNSGSEKRPKT